MRNLVFCLVLLITNSAANATIVKSLAFDRLADLDKVVALDGKTLAEMRSPNSNKTLLVRDQNVRYMKLIEKSKSTFGDDPLSPQGSCVKALASAHEAWQSKVAYEQSKANFDKDSLSRWQKSFASEYKECRSYVGKLQ